MQKSDEEPSIWLEGLLQQYLCPVCATSEIAMFYIAPNFQNAFGVHGLRGIAEKSGRKILSQPWM